MHMQGHAEPSPRLVLFCPTIRARKCYEAALLASQRIISESRFHNIGPRCREAVDLGDFDDVWRAWARAHIDDRGYCPVCKWLRRWWR